ncbi:hypothetical protein FA95DRAFT_1674160 [Auriscalpium vulgare]|uniref:Uncharacterized protein n=1 Tax=Auriscalpium vulgare TaxID=40419 RepID=A0ACB8SB24_9AGAM|nr:hypothetical protein FA95DRAFT_1674160 [Auriscalpium vulgare]
MDSFPPKRIVTESERAMSNVSFTTSASDLISPDLSARLQNVGSRVRRSVSQGYATDRFTSALTSSRTMTRTISTPLSSLDEAPLFQSSNDTLHAVYSQMPPSSSREGKRRRAHATMDEEVDGEYADVDKREDDEHFDGATPSTALADGPIAPLRPMKPLRRTPRTFGQTQSLPAAVFGASPAGANPPNEVTAFQKFGNMEEEDWSAANFPSVSPAGTLLKPS